MKYVNSELTVVLQVKLEYWRCRKTNSNYTKKTCRYMMMLQFLSILPPDFVIDCEPASDKNPDEPNAGSLLEIVMRYAYEKNPELMELSKSGGTSDITMRNGRGIEIKLSLDGMTYNTAIHEPMRIYLANRDGVYIIEKKDIDYIITTYGKSGHLPYKHYEDAKMRLHKGLTKALGYKVKQLKPKTKSRERLKKPIQKNKKTKEKRFNFMVYALINYGTGEILSISGEKITCQHLYNRALSQRREAVRYGYALDKMQLVKCSDYEHIMNGAVIQEWEGGLNTPIDDLRLRVRTYWTFKNRRLNTVGLMLDYIKQEDIFRRLPSKALYELAEVIKPYDEATACGLIRRVNLRKMKKPL